MVMRNFVQKGDDIDVVAPSGGLASGDFYLLGALGGVCATAGAQGVTVTLKRYGVFTLPKATGAAWSEGDQLYWDNSAKKFTKTTSGNTKWGVAAADAASGDATGSVLLSGIG